MKKILFILSAFFCLLLAAGCGKDSEKKTPPVRTTSQYILTYSAGENGTIDGNSSQKVDHGGGGSPVTAVPAENHHFTGWSDGLDTPSRTDRDITADLELTATFAINQYSLAYSTGEKGSIEGVINQKVAHGGDCSPVTAIPAEHYHFIGWSDGVTTPTRTDCNITADLELTAVFAVNQYTPAYTADENGTFDGSRKYVDHGDGDSPLTVVPAEHHPFSDWIYRNVMAKLELTPSFALEQYTLRYSAGENGSIKGAGTQKIYHGDAGSIVKAMPAAGYHFVNWSDGLATANRTDSKVTADLELTATFASNQYSLTYSAGENGSIEGDEMQTVNHGGDGSQVTSVPDDYHHFVNWSDGVATASRTDRMVTADLTVTANFSIDQYTLSYTAGENGAIDGVSIQKVDHGDTGSMVKAIPATGYHFLNWSDGLATASRIDSKVTADLELTAIFAINQYSLTYSAGENGSIDGLGQHNVDHGADASAVTAVAKKGYHFVSWSDGVTTAQRIDSKVTGDLAVSAIFAVTTYTVSGSVSGLVEDTQLVLQNNNGDDLLITANGDFHFATELLNSDTYEVRVLTQPTSPNQNCTVTSSTGTISYENVNDIAVTCVPVTYTIGGTVSGLPDDDQVVLRNIEGDDLAISSNGIFTFAIPLDDGSEYEVKVSSQPQKSHWTCEVENAAGVLAGMNVTDILVDCYPEAVLQATAGIRKIKLSWNSHDFSELSVSFNLCLAQEDISKSGYSNCLDLEGGVLKKKVNNPQTIIELINDIPYWFQLEALYASGRQTLSEVVMAIPFGGLNDSGIDWCASEISNHESDGTRAEKSKSCDTLAASHPGQDAVHGRDALARARKLKKTGNGAAGFDFTKICSSGEPAGEGKCPPNPLPGNDLNNWACIRDNTTGLTWEIKMASGLRNRRNTFSWHNPDKTLNGGGAGLKNGGKCEGSACDTLAYVQTINETGLCGVNDWRLPTKRELLSIVNNGGFKPAIDARSFPNTLSSYYWSSSPYSEEKNSAWQVYFLYGEASPNNKSEKNHIRLVRGRTVTFGLDNP